MASIRYFDWAITTPTMLLTTIIYFKYEEYLENNEEKALRFVDFLQDNVQNIIIIVVCNFLMLLFGYLGEIGLIDMTSSIVLGFAFFAYSFYVIYRNYAIKSKRSLNLFYFILSVWSLYGVAAIFSPHHKNNTFNILDIFAKNFFGLYLYYKALEVHRADIQ
jgi:bacteriorhodopsin